LKLESVVPSVNLMEMWVLKNIQGRGSINLMH